MFLYVIRNTTVVGSLLKLVSVDDTIFHPPSPYFNGKSAINLRQLFTRNNEPGVVKLKKISESYI